MTDKVEHIIFEGLLHNESYARKVLPFIREEYFNDRTDKELFRIIGKFYEKYNKPPSEKALLLTLEESRDLKQDEFDLAHETVSGLKPSSEDGAWLEDRTEKFCKDKAIYNAIISSISILDGKQTKFKPEAIPSILQEALAVTFDNRVGHDYFSEASDRFDFYHLKEDRLRFGLEMFNKITKGGLPRKTLSCVLAPVNCGKSLFLCDYAAKVIQQGKNVLYITLEMAEERISERIDCNLLDVTLDDLYRMKKADFTSKLNTLKEKAYGSLVVKEYPTSCGHVGHFRNLLNELALKRKFKPDLICIDYINICSSMRMQGNAMANSYTIVKAIAEELRGLAVEYDVPIITATQTTRSGWQNTDIEMSDVAESAGLPATVDFLFAIMRTEELDEQGQLMIKQIKSRFNDTNYYKRFVIGVQINKFKLHDVDNEEQSLSDMGKVDDTPIFDKSKFGGAMKQRGDTSSINFD